MRRAVGGRGDRGRSFMAVSRDMSRWTGVIALLLACAPAPAPVRPRALADKRALYGDPGLVPTRAGERARQELALAASVTAALRARAGEGPLAVEVRLPAGGDPGAAVITGELALAGATATRIAEGVLGPWSAGRVQLELAAPASPPRDEPEPTTRAGARPGWPLALALLGLGLSAGVSIERLRRRR
jgi:hypothetical protein